MMNKKFLLVVIAAIFLLTSGIREVYGWGKTWIGKDLERIMNEAGWSIGPFKIKTVLFLNNAGYDSNVYRRPFDPIKDYTFTIGPGIYIYLPIKKKIILSIYESPRYVYFKETKKERTWNNYFKGQVHFVFNRVLFSLGKGFSVAREIWNTEIDIRPQRREDSLKGSFLWQASKKTSFFLRFRRAKYDYEDLSYEQINIRDQLNREENYVNFTGYYKLSYRTRFFLDLEYGFFNFENPSNFRDSQSYGVYGGFEFSPFGVIKGRINLGYKSFDSLDPGSKDYRGIVGDSSISIRLFRPLNVRASYKRDVEFSVWYGNTYFLENNYGSGISIYLSKNIRLDYDYRFGRNQYPEIMRLAESLWEERKDDYEIHSVGIYLRLKENIGIGVTARKWIRDSNLDWWDGKRNFIGVNLTYDF